MKKTLAALLATVFAASLYAADASACPGHDKDKGATVTKKDTKKNEETAKDQEKPKQENDKERAAPKAPAKKKVS
jgi:hypothetical protein